MAESVLGSDIDVAKEWESLDVMSSLLKPQTGVNASSAFMGRKRRQSSLELCHPEDAGFTTLYHLTHKKSKCRPS